MDIARESKRTAIVNAFLCKRLEKALSTRSSTTLTFAVYTPPVSRRYLGGKFALKLTPEGGVCYSLVARYILRGPTAQYWCEGSQRVFVDLKTNQCLCCCSPPNIPGRGHRAGWSKLQSRTKQYLPVERPIIDDFFLKTPPIFAVCTCIPSSLSRRSTTETNAHPNFSEALLHLLEELHTSPENWLQQTSTRIPMNNPMAS